MNIQTGDQLDWWPGMRARNNVTSRSVACIAPPVGIFCRN